MSTPLLPITEGHLAKLDTIVQALSASYGWTKEQAREYLRCWEDRHGGPSRRFGRLIEAMQTRFPAAISIFSSAPAEPAYLEQIDRLLAIEQAGPAQSASEAANRDLHLSVMRAVALLNDTTTTDPDSNLLKAKEFLRQGLIDYAVAAGKPEKS